jgi:hypothetical protein
VKSTVSALRLLWRQRFSDVCSVGNPALAQSGFFSEVTPSGGRKYSSHWSWKNRACLLLALVSAYFPIFAQGPVSMVSNTTMTPTPGAGHDYIQSLAETVNPANGSVSVRIAAPTPTERGLNLPTYAYIYDTNGQIQIQPNFVASDNPNTYPTLLHAVVAAVGVGYGSTGGSPITGAPNTNTGATGTLSRTNVSMNSGVAHNCTYTTNYVYTDTSGGRHQLNIFYIAAEYATANACGYFGGYPDPTGYTTGGDDSITATLVPNSSDVYIYDLHGNQLNPDYQVEDTNGNYLNGTGRPYAGTYTETDIINDVGYVSPTALTIPGLGTPAGQSGTVYLFLSINCRSISPVPRLAECCRNRQ